MAALLRLKSHDVEEREIYLFDTFDGMTEPDRVDMDFKGDSAKELLASSEPSTSDIWAKCSLEDVRRNVESVRYDARRIHFVEGRVEDTLTQNAPEQIALLRLDTDWYQSTYHEMSVLFPKLVDGGILIIDDYGHWQGARKAVDKYVAENRLKLFLTPMDYTGRIAVKQGMGVSESI